MSNETNKPVKSLRDGHIKATIWRNESEKGDYYSVNFTRIYKDGEGNWKDTDSFTGTDILKVQHLAGKAYDAIAKLRKADEVENGGAQ